MDDDGLVVIPGIAPHCGTLTKRRFVADVATPFMSRFSKAPIPRPSKIVADGDDVIVIADAHGVTVSGKLYLNQYVFVLHFCDGKLIQATEFLDMAAFNVVWDSVAPQKQTTKPERVTL